MSQLKMRCQFCFVHSQKVQRVVIAIQRHAKLISRVADNVSLVFDGDFDRANFRVLENLGVWSAGVGIRT